MDGTVCESVVKHCWMNKNLSAARELFLKGGFLRLQVGHFRLAVLKTAQKYIENRIYYLYNLRVDYVPPLENFTERR